MAVTRDDFNTARTMRVLIGSEAGTRLTASQVQGRAFAEWNSLGRNAEGIAWITAKLDAFKARGWVEDAPGPRGGRGYTLTPAGAAWMASALAWRSLAAKRAEARTEKERQRRARLERDYRAVIEGPTSRRAVSVRAIGMGDAAQLAGHHVHRHAQERLTAVWEADATSALIDTITAPTDAQQGAPVSA